MAAVRKVVIADTLLVGHLQRMRMLASTARFSPQARSTQPRVAKGGSTQRDRDRRSDFPRGPLYRRLSFQFAIEARGVDVIGSRKRLDMSDLLQQSRVPLRKFVVLDTIRGLVGLDVENWAAVKEI